jgi:L-arabinose isomerase
VPGRLKPGSFVNKFIESMACCFLCAAAPVACALWIPQPNIEVGAGAWITAGGTHHSSFSFSITTDMMEDYAEILDIEMLIIDKDTNIRQFKQEMRNNEVYYMLNKALR